VLSTERARAQEGLQRSVTAGGRGLQSASLLLIPSHGVGSAGEEVPHVLWAQTALC